MSLRRLVACLLLGAGSSFLAPAGSQADQNADWPTYLAHPDRSGFTWSSVNAGNLAIKWTVAQGAITDQPTVAGGFVYWGDWSGFEHAATVAGAPVWSRFIGQTTILNQGCNPTTVGVASSATIYDGIVYVGGGDAKIYALDGSSGAVLWSRSLGVQGNTFIWDSPLVYNGQVYIGTASFGDCPVVQGRLFSLNAASGSVTKVLNLAPNGCVGVGLWGSPTLSGTNIYIATGNPGGTVANPTGACPKGEPLNEALVELNPANLKVEGYWSVPKGLRVKDSDFGATPTLFRGFVGVVNKNGWFYSFHKNALGKGPAWSDHLGGEGVDFSPATFNGTYLFVASGPPVGPYAKSHKCRGMLRAIRPTTGAYVWQDCLKVAPYGAPVSAPGIVILSEGHEILVVSSANGRILFDGVFPEDWFVGPASIAAGVLYQGGISGTLYALGSSS